MLQKRGLLGRTLAALALFGVSFAYVEAAVVVYLGELFQPLVGELRPERSSSELFPLITRAELEAAGSEHLRMLKVEVIREAATMIMLASLGLAVAWNCTTWLAGFMIAFGVWDICYYVFLHLLSGRPTSLFELDLLFLIPLPWVGPVLAPVLVAISMVVAGILLLLRESAGRPVHMSWQDWLALIMGGLVIVVAFCWDYRQVMAGELPGPFPWAIFLTGEAIGLVAFTLAFIRSSQDTERSLNK